MNFLEIKNQLKSHSKENRLIQKAIDTFKEIIVSCLDESENHNEALKKAVNNRFGFGDINIRYITQTFCFDHESIDDIMIYTNFDMIIPNDEDSDVIGRFVYISDKLGKYYDQSFYIFGYHK